MRKVPQYKKIRKTFQSPRQLRAIALGPIELMNLLEWRFRNRPTALLNVRREYREFCIKLYNRLRRADRRMPRRLAA